MIYVANFILVTAAVWSLYQWRVERARREQAEKIVRQLSDTVRVANDYVRAIK